MARFDVLLSLCRRRIKTDSWRSAWSWQSRSCSRCCWKWRLSWLSGWLRSPRCCSWSPVGRGRGGPVPVLSHRAPPRAAQSTKERGRGGGAARLRWERSLSVRQSPLPCHPCVNFPPVLSCALCVPRMLQLRVTAARSSVSNSKPSRIKN